LISIASARALLTLLEWQHQDGVTQNNSQGLHHNALPTLFRALSLLLTQELGAMLLFVNKRTASERLNLSDSTLKKYRLQGEWIEGIHWVRINSRCVRYNLELIQDWLHNRGNPNAHLRAIQTYQQGLLSNQRRKRQ
jgi:CHAD domain-containing protein